MQAKPAQSSSLWGITTEDFQEQTRISREASKFIVNREPMDASLPPDPVVSTRVTLLTNQAAAQPRKKYQTAEQLVLNDIAFEHKKYAAYDSGSEHSSGDEADIRVDVDDLVLEIKKDPQYGKLTFISKIVTTKSADPVFKVEKIKSILKQMPNVVQINSKDCFVIYEIDINSDMRKFAINFLYNNKVVRKTAELIFLPRIIALDLPLSYDIVKGCEVKINALEGLLAYCVIEGTDFAEEIIKLHKRRELKDKIITEKCTVDSMTRKLIRENRNNTHLLRLMTRFLTEDQWSFAKVSKYAKNPAYLDMVDIYMEEMLRFNPVINLDDKFALTQEETLIIIEFFLHFICLSNRKTDSIKLPENRKAELDDKIKELIDSLFHVPEISSYIRFVNFCLDNSLPLLSMGFSTIRDLANISLNSAEKLVVHLKNILYNVLLKGNKTNPIILFTETFKDCRFVENNIYEIWMEDILSASQKLFALSDISSLKFTEFISFFKVYTTFKSNPHISKVITSKISDEIVRYMDNIRQKIARASDEQKLKGIELVEIYFISMKDPELNRDQTQLKNIFVYLADKRLSIDVQTALFKVYFQILKRGEREYKPQTVREISNSLGKALSFHHIKVAFDIVKKHYKEDAIQDTTVLKILDDQILNPFINRQIVESEQFLDKASENGSLWHFDFKYPFHFNELMVERMVRVIQKVYRSNKAYLKTSLAAMKREIQQFVDNKDNKEHLLAIIQIDMIDLDVAHVLEIFTSKRSFLKLFQKILSKDYKNQVQQEFLRESLKEISHSLETKQLSFQTVCQIKNMKPHEWNIFCQVTEEYELPEMIEAEFSTGNEYVNNIRKLISFVRELQEKYNCPDYQAELEKLQKALSMFELTALKHSKIEEFAPTFKKFNYDIIKCYRFKYFFESQNVIGKNVDDIIRISHKMLQKLFESVNKIFKDYKEGKLVSDLLYRFSPRKEDLEQFKAILCFNRLDDIPDSLQDIVGIYELIAEAETNFNNLGSIVSIQRNKFHTKEKILVQFHNICEGLKDRKTINISNLLESYNNTNIKLKQYKLSLKQPHHRSIMEFLKQVIDNFGSFETLKKINQIMADLKEKISEDGGQVTEQILENCEIVLQFIKIFEVNGNSFNFFIDSVHKFVEKCKEKEPYIDMGYVAFSVFQSKEALEEQRKNFLDSHRDAVKIMDEICRKCTFELGLAEDRETLFERITIYPKQSKPVDPKEFWSTKEKAILILPSLNENQADRKKVISEFLKICKKYQQLIECEKSLVEWGYKHFENKNIVVNNSNDFSKITSERNQLLKPWITKVKSIYSTHFKAAHLQGKKLREFYNYIRSKDDSISPHFSQINCDQRLHKTIKIKVLQMKEPNTPQKYLQMIQLYFTTLREEQAIVQAPDRDQKLFHTRIMSEGEDFMVGIEEIGKERIENFKFEHILICTPQTKTTQISSFVQRALRDIDSQYVILGYQYLNRKKQQHIVDEIQNYKAQIGNEELKLKLCMVGNSEVEFLYKFAKAELGVGSNQAKAGHVNDCKKIFLKRLEQESQNTRLVTSACPGDGKSTFIRDDSKAKGCNDWYFFPLSGRMNGNYLWEKYNQMVAFLKNSENQKKKPCIVIQIFNIQKTAIEAVNRFLSNIIFFKHHSDGANVLSFSKDVPIYIELESITEPQSKDDLKADLIYPPQIRQLPFLKQLVKAFSHTLWKKIDKFDRTTIKLDLNDKKTNFMLNYLSKLDSLAINSQTIERYDAYVNIPIQQVQAKRLICKYFFDKFKEDDTPSGYLWKYFSSLIFEATNCFGNSMFLLIDTLKMIDSDVKGFNAGIHAQMKLKETFRGEFLKVVVENSIDFIKRSVRPGREGEDSALKATLQDLPFLIIPNTDGESFSFIYNNSNKVPATIKNMIVLQETKLVNRIGRQTINSLFEEQNIAKFQKDNIPKWIDKASQILQNISGNRGYKINCEPGYIVNIDNFFKMCLITQRMRLNIPIVIMGEAGIGKTALLRHVVKHLYKHEFAVYNINAGIPLEKQQENQTKNVNQSLVQMVQDIKTRYDNMVASNLQKDEKKKLWVFFDQFNTLRELGFFKELIIDGKFLGVEQAHTKNVIMMAACNPYKKLEINKAQVQQAFTLEKKDKLAFDVLPAPHSLIEAMWNFGSLSPYEYQKYISKMICDIDFLNKEVVKLVLEIHSEIGKWLFDSAVSLRDIERLRQLYVWFKENLPKQFTFTKNKVIKLEMRCLVMSLYFTYVLRFGETQRELLEIIIEKHLGLNKNNVRSMKDAEEEEICKRLNLNIDGAAALNESLRENIYSCFVCIYTHLPLLIIGAPGSSKSLSLRILSKNLKDNKKMPDEYFKKFSTIKQFPLQGSENTTTKDIKFVFDKAYDEIAKKKIKNKENSVVVFDEIGLAEKSSDNPLKVLHPYLEVNRESDQGERILSFIGISNSELDVSKMSRLLVLRRPPAKEEDLISTAITIAASYENGQQNVFNFIVKMMAKSYAKFIGVWKNKVNNFPLFFGLRDFYGLIKTFMIKINKRKIKGTQDDHDLIVSIAAQAIFENFNGWEKSSHQFTRIFYEHIKYNEIIEESSMKSIIDSIVSTLSEESMRFPMIIAEDTESLSFIKWIIENRFNQKSMYIEGSPFQENRDYSLKLLGQVCQQISKDIVLIMNNLSEGVKTGLYDFFNKSYNIYENTKKKYLRIRNQQNSMNQKNFEYNDKFNCTYLVEAKHLGSIEPPFLSRFQKFRFSLEKYRSETCPNILPKLNRFVNKIEQICQNNNLSHYTFSHLFANSCQKSLKSLSVATFEQSGETHAFNESIRSLVFNSGQQFYFIFKYFIQKNGAEMPELVDLISSSINDKNSEERDKSLIIRFTTDSQYIKNMQGQNTKSFEFETLKTEADFDNILEAFYKKTENKTLYVSLRVLEEAKYLNYIVGKIEKIKRRAHDQGFVINDKRVRLVYKFDRNRIEVKTNIRQIDVPVSYFTKFIQEFDDGKVGEISNNNREQFFKTTVPISNLCKYVQKLIDIRYDNPENSIKSKLFLENIIEELFTNRDGLFIKNCEEALVKFQGMNFELSEQIYKEILNDKKLFEKHKNFKEVITKHLADKKYLAALGYFFKYLFDKQAFLSLSSEFLSDYINSQAFATSAQFSRTLRQTKQRKRYVDFVKEYIKNKLLTMVGDYKMRKAQRLTLTADKRMQITLQKPRIIPFSKDQCKLILDPADKGLSEYIKKVYSGEDNQFSENDYKLFISQFNKKSTFNTKTVNLYTKCINEDKDLKKLLFLDLLSDFVEARGLPIKHLLRYYETISPFFEIKSGRKSREEEQPFAKMICTLIAFEEIWIQIFRIIATFEDEQYYLQT